MASDQERIAILFIHGILGTTSHFEPFLSLVPTNWSICNLSLKGHGEYKNFMVVSSYYRYIFLSRSMDIF